MWHLHHRIRNIHTDTALGVPGVSGVEKTFARKTGLEYHVELHLQVATLE